MDQIQREKVLEKLGKIKALAERGVGGEKETAMRMYEELCRKYEISEDEAEAALMKLEKRWFSYSTQLEEELLKQIFYKVTGDTTHGECKCNKCGEYKLTGEQRTGCKLCGFGIMYDPERFVRLNEFEPKIVKFAFTSKENGGLGYREICKFLNEYCGMKIVIPDVEDGFYKSRAEAYKKRKEARAAGNADNDNQ